MKDLGLTLNWVADQVKAEKLSSILMELRGKKVTGISTDSRTVGKGEIFVALSGENFDGHRYVSDALARGALAAVSQQPIEGEAEARILRVKDSLEALGDLAGGLRSRCPLKVIGLTGSNGKTTTKEMLATILSLKDPHLLATEGNFNNLVGLPLTLFKMSKRTTQVVLEMGMNHFGEIARLTEIARPDVGLITSVGAAHLEFFGTVNRVARAKGELYGGLNPAAVAVVPADEPLLVQEAARFSGNKLFFGFEVQTKTKTQSQTKAQVRLKFLRTDRLKGQHLILYGPGAEKGLEVKLKLLGKHNAHNALAAAATALAAGAGWEEIVQGLEMVTSFPGRLEFIKARRFLLLNDSYNANPASMTAGLEAMAELNIKGPKGAILGDMKELGSGEVAHHRTIGRLAAEHLDFLAGVGPLSRFTVQAAQRAGMAKENAGSFGTPEEAAQWVAATRATRSSKTRVLALVLVKGSHSLKLQQAVTYLKNV